MKLVYEVPYYPQYYFPIADVRTELLVPTDTVTHSPSRGDARHFTVATGRTSAVDAASRIPGLTGRGASRPRTVRLRRDAVVRGGRGDLRPPAEPDDAYRRARQLASRPGGRGRRHDRRLAPAAAVVRDRPPDPLLPAQGRRPHGPPRAHVLRERLPVQGRRARTGRCGSVGSSTRTSRGRIPRRCRRARRSRGWSASTTSGSTSSSTASSPNARRRSSRRARPRTVSPDRARRPARPSSLVPMLVEHPRARTRRDPSSVRVHRHVVCARKEAPARDDSVEIRSDGQPAARDPHQPREVPVVHAPQPHRRRRSRGDQEGHQGGPRRGRRDRRDRGRQRVHPLRTHAAGRPHRRRARRLPAVPRLRVARRQGRQGHPGGAAPLGALGRQGPLLGDPVEVPQRGRGPHDRRP